jgi:hypothetical protein
MYYITLILLNNVVKLWNNHTLYCRSRFNYQGGILLTGVISPYVCVCPKRELEFSSENLVVIFVLIFF